MEDLRLAAGLALGAGLSIEASMADTEGDFSFLPAADEAFLRLMAAAEEEENDRRYGLGSLGLALTSTSKLFDKK